LKTKEEAMQEYKLDWVTSAALVPGRNESSVPQEMETLNPSIA
jgi:hypothetical protein